MVVETASYCPFCGSVLELVEDELYVWFGCRRCMRYVKRDKKEVVKRIHHIPRGEDRKALGDAVRRAARKEA